MRSGRCGTGSEVGLPELNVGLEVGYEKRAGEVGDSKGSGSIDRKNVVATIHPSVGPPSILHRQTLFGS